MVCRLCISPWQVRRNCRSESYVIRRSRVLSFAVAEGPVFLLHFNKIDKDVFGPQAWTFAEVGGDAREEPFFLFDCSSVADGELDDREVVGVLEPKVARRMHYFSLWPVL